MRLTVLLLCLVTAVVASDVFYYNTVSGATQWERPAEMPLRDQDGRAYWEVDGEARWVPPTGWAWEEAHDPDGHVYYHNTVTGETSWHKPEAAAWTARSAKRYFFHNTVTGETSRHPPAVLGHHDDVHNATYYNDGEGGATWDPPEASAWARAKDVHTGRDYFHNKRTGEATWEAPKNSNAAWRKWHEEVRPGDEEWP